MFFKTCSLFVAFALSACATAPLTNEEIAAGETVERQACATAPDFCEVGSDGRLHPASKAERARATPVF